MICLAYLNPLFLLARLVALVRAGLYSDLDRVRIPALALQSREHIMLVTVLVEGDLIDDLTLVPNVPVAEFHAS